MCDQTVLSPFFFSGRIKSAQVDEHDADLFVDSFLNIIFLDSEVCVEINAMNYLDQYSGKIEAKRWHHGKINLCSNLQENFLHESN